MLKNTSTIEGKKYTALFLPMSSSAGLDSANLPASSSSCFVFSSVLVFDAGTGSTSIFGLTVVFFVVVGSGPKAVGWLLQLSV